MIVTRSLKEIFATVEPGDDDWSWKSQFDWLRFHRTEELETLRADMKKNGQREPIHIGDDGRLWDGHHRLCAAYELGWDDIVCRV